MDEYFDYDVHHVMSTVPTHLLMSCNVKERCTFYIVANFNPSNLTCLQNSIPFFGMYVICTRIIDKIKKMTSKIV